MNVIVALEKGGIRWHKRQEKRLWLILHINIKATRGQTSEFENHGTENHGTERRAALLSTLNCGLGLVGVPYQLLDWKCIVSIS